MAFAMARTMLDEIWEERVDRIEHQLVHAVIDPMDVRTTAPRTCQASVGANLQLERLCTYS
jgi:hypothetical protein